MLIPNVQIKESTLVRRRRELPLKGELLFKLGDAVRASDIVARASVPGELHILRIADKLGIEPFEVLKGLRVKLGDQVKVGDLLCEHIGIFGLFRSKNHSVVSGVLEFINEKNGHVGVRAAPKMIELDAYIDGVVESAEDGKALIIASEASVVQGIFGVGGEKRGTLCALAVGRDEKVVAAHIPTDCRGLILFGGKLPNTEAVTLAAERGAKGFVTASVEDHVLAQYLGYDLGVAVTGDEAVPMTFIITDGFGNLGMSEMAHKILSALAGKSAAINGATQVRAGAIRPEIIVTQNTLPKSNQQEPKIHLLVGSQVRMVRVPYFGQFAQVVDLPTELQVIETGAKARVARVKLASGQEVVVPRVNLELVGS